MMSTPLLDTLPIFVKKAEEKPLLNGNVKAYSISLVFLLYHSILKYSLLLNASPSNPIFVSVTVSQCRLGLGIVLMAEPIYNGAPGAKFTPFTEVLPNPAIPE